jgi:hypothetical protein
MPLGIPEDQRIAYSRFAPVGVRAVSTFFCDSAILAETLL